MGMSYRGFGRGKLLLFGEHAAVKGYPAVGLALEAGIGIRLEPEEARGIWTLVDFDEAGNKIARAVMKRVDEAIPGLPKGGLIRVESELPMGRGLGSSAALCVALAEAGLAAAGTAEAIRHRSLVWNIAHHAEAYFHGTPSGIDTGLAALGGLVSFKPSPPDLPEARRLAGWPLHLLVGTVPRSSDSKTLIARVREATAAAESPANQTLARLGELAASAIALLGSRSPEPEALGVLADEAEAELELLGLVAGEVSQVLEEGRKDGALGGKMSGAGGGGAFWLLYPDRESAERARTKLRDRTRGWKPAPDLSLEVYSYGATLRP